MRKMPTVFERDWDSPSHPVIDKPNPDAQWVFDGEGVATRKYDGTCVMFDGERWYARREVKPGKQEPPNFVSLDQDAVTGKRMGWEPAEQSPFYAFLVEALSYFDGQNVTLRPGTYELIGPKINGNPEGVISDRHIIVSHAQATIYPNVPRTYEGIQGFLAGQERIEGLVFQHPDGRMAKIKRKDFPS
jgi:Family of unknown function (DUF5565)